MDDPEEVFGQAFAAVDRLQNLKPRERSADLTDWEKSMPKPASPPRQMKLDTAPAGAIAVDEPDPSWDDWNAWYDQRVAAAIEEFKAFNCKVMGEVLAEIKHEIYTRMEKYRCQVEVATAEVKVLRAEIQLLRGGKTTERAPSTTNGKTAIN